MSIVGFAIEPIWGVAAISLERHLIAGDYGVVVGALRGRPEGKQGQQGQGRRQEMVGCLKVREQG